MSRRGAAIVLISVTVLMSCGRAARESGQHGVLHFATTLASQHESGDHLVIALLRSGGSEGRVSVTLSSQDVSATAGSDYLGVDSTVTFEHGDVELKLLQVALLNDSVQEGDETFRVHLSNPTGGVTLSNSTLTATIRDGAPIARVGGDDNGEVGTRLTLDATQSIDPDGDPLSFAWSLVTRPSGSNAQIDDASQALASITPDQSGDYAVRITVSDGNTTVANEVWLSVFEPQ